MENANAVDGQFCAISRIKLHISLWGSPAPPSSSGTIAENSFSCFSSSQLAWTNRSFSSCSAARLAKRSPRRWISGLHSNTGPPMKLPPPPYHRGLCYRAQMREYVIEREVPGAGNFTEDQIREASLKSLEILGNLGPQIRWLHSYVTDDKIYCVYMAPDEATIQEHAKIGRAS